MIAAMFTFRISEVTRLTAVGAVPAFTFRSKRKTKTVCAFDVNVDMQFLTLPLLSGQRKWKAEIGLVAIVLSLGSSLGLKIKLIPTFLIFLFPESF